jgi:hypothetical protein
VPLLKISKWRLKAAAASFSIFKHAADGKPKKCILFQKQINCGAPASLTNASRETRLDRLSLSLTGFIVEVAKAGAGRCYSNLRLNLTSQGYFSARLVDNAGTSIV